MLNSRNSRSRPPARLGFERLEDRSLPSALVALTEQQELIRFDSSDPGTILGSAAISGLPAGETIAGIDTRPATGELYALGTSGSLYVLDPVSGSATLRATLAADPNDLSDPYPGLQGDRLSIDFNPVADRLRIVSDTGQNLRVNPDTGAVITDGNLAYAAGDPNAGTAPTIGDIAYANNVAGATSTALYGIDQGLRVLALQNPPNAGQLTTVGPRFLSSGFDIAPSGTAFVVDVLQFSQPIYALATFDVSTGRVLDPLGYIGDGLAPVRDVAVVPGVRFSSALLATTEGAALTVTVELTDRTVGTVTVDYSTADLSAAAGQDYGAVNGTLTFGPGETVKTFTVAITDDTDGEGDEFFALALDNASGAVVSGPSVPVRISANDVVDRSAPVLVGVAETGPSRGITGFVLFFSEDLDPARAVDLANYTFDGIDARGRKTHIRLASAEYDAANRAVVVRVAQPFDQTRFASMEIRVKGDRSGAVTDAAGNRLDGDLNGRAGGFAFIELRVFSGTTLTIPDADGDVAVLTISNGGRLDGILPVLGRGKNTVQFAFQDWVVDPISESSVVTGTVTTSTTGDGLVKVAEIIGLDHCDITSLQTSTSLQISKLTFSSNATGTLR